MTTADLRAWGYAAPAGSIVVVHYGDYRRQEIWVADGSNIGNWYPENRDWLKMTDKAGRPFDRYHHPAWDDVLDRGPVTLLVASQDEAYAAGWAAGRTDLLHKIEELAEEGS